MPRSEDKPEKNPPFDPESLFLSMERARRTKSSTPEDWAQELYYDAMEEGRADKQLELLRQALDLDPGNVDCLVAFLGYLNKPLDEEITALRAIVAVGEDRLGKKIFQEMKGNFWSYLETRPYMRARHHLAEALLSAGRSDEAIAEWKGMLELNPGDNQGVRYALCSCLLAESRFEEVAELFEQYPEHEFNTMWSWGQVLERYLTGDLDGAKKAVEVARKQNPFSEPYILGHRRIPKNLPGTYGLGSKEEAVCFASDLMRAWKPYPEAKAWLISQKTIPGGG